MKSIIIIIIIIALFAQIQLFAEGRAIDTVYYFKPGTGQDIGQSAEYFPANIFGLPSRNASYSLPEAAPEQLLSLGFGGEIIVGIKNYKIVDKPGADFTIFENCFFNPVTKKLFAEPAKVSVSKDGVNFIEFPYNKQTLEGLAGKTPVNGSEDPFNPNVSGGDSFDISQLGLDFITHIKISDVTQIIEKLPEENIYYQPAFILTGFDLDAVLGLNTEAIESNINDFSNNENFKIINNNSSIHIINKNNLIFDVIVYDYFGRIISKISNTSQTHTKITNLSTGIYFVNFQTNNASFNRMVIIVN